MMCCPLSNDGDGPEFCTVSKPRAGKDHRCCECGMVIAKGTVHELAEVWYQLQESMFPDMNCGGRCMQGLSPAAKQRLIDARMAWLFDHEIERDGAPPPRAQGASHGG